jgi:hypothetical protein
LRSHGITTPALNLSGLGGGVFVHRVPNNTSPQYHEAVHKCISYLLVAAHAYAGVNPRPPG